MAGYSDSKRGRGRRARGESHVAEGIEDVHFASVASNANTDELPATDVLAVTLGFGWTRRRDLPGLKMLRPFLGSIARPFVQVMYVTAYVAYKSRK